MDKILIVGAPASGKTKMLKEMTKGYKEFIIVEGFRNDDFKHLDGYSKPLFATCNRLFDEYMIYRFDKIIFLQNNDELTVNTALSLCDKDVRDLRKSEYVVHNNSNTMFDEYEKMNKKGIEIAKAVCKRMFFSDTTNLKKHYS